MCRLILRRYNNHKFATATLAVRQALWQAGDAISRKKDGVSFGIEAERSPIFYILELPGVALNKLDPLFEEPEHAQRLRHIDLAMLRTKLTSQETSKLNAGKMTLVEGEKKVRQSTKLRPT